MAEDSERTAWIFPGQGAQKVGMGRDLFDEFPAARAVFEQADAALGRDLSSIIFEGPEDELVRTINTQPAILVTSLACLAAAQASGEVLGPTPSFMAGHSLGEYTALVAAGSLTIEVGIRLVQERGRVMQAACDQNPSGMAALIGLDEAAVESICAETGAELCNINSQSQIAIGGRHENVAAAMELAKERGARRAIQLKVGGAFHSSAMRPAAEGMAAALADVEFAAPRTPVVGNVTGTAMTTVDEVRAELTSQVRETVRWRQGVETMIAGKVESFVEIGPGTALTGMVRTIAGDLKPRLRNLNNAASIRGDH
ncbi:MAG TPA: ACP S-malonyltransferase [Dehalococcoidia bacterium]|nr:ACP S-malonyltransferase [Dehalococcoidia bacterium]